MPHFNTDHLNRCLETLETSLAHLSMQKPETIEYEVFRNAVVKGFELTLETSGKLLRKALRVFGGTPKSIDELYFKDLLRESAKRGLLAPEALERWFAYRDNRNDTAHDYGVAFAEETVLLLPGFIRDARTLSASLQKHFDETAHD